MTLSMGILLKGKNMIELKNCCSKTWRVIAIAAMFGFVITIIGLFGTVLKLKAQSYSGCKFISGIRVKNGVLFFNKLTVAPNNEDIGVNEIALYPQGDDFYFKENDGTVMTVKTL